MNPLDLLRPEIRTLKPYSIVETPSRIKMDANESPFDPPEEIRQEISQGLRNIHFNRYPDPGAVTLKKRISEYLQVEPERLMLGNGSDELIGYLITAFTGQNSGVLFPSPTFSMYGIIARAQGQTAIEVPLDDQFQIDSTVFLQAVRKHSPQIVFLASPNNPTGNGFPEEAVLRILEETHAIVVADEAYIDFSNHPGFIKHLQTTPNLVILRTLSKIGMAALRIGILVSSREVIGELEKVRLPYNINTFSQAAASALLSHPEALKKQIRMIIEERNRLFESMSGIKEIQTYPSQANFILFRTQGAEELYRGLLKAGILVRNLNQPGPLQGCLRVTVGMPEENTEFLEHLGRFF